MSRTSSNAGERNREILWHRNPYPLPGRSGRQRTTADDRRKNFQKRLDKPPGWVYNKCVKGKGVFESQRFKGAFLIPSKNILRKAKASFMSYRMKDAFSLFNAKGEQT